MRKQFYFAFLSLVFLYVFFYENKNLNRLYVIYESNENVNLINSQFLLENIIKEKTFKIRKNLNSYKIDKVLNYESNKIKRNSYLLSNNFHQVYFFSDKIKKKDIQNLKSELNENLIQKINKIELIYVE